MSKFQIICVLLLAFVALCSCDAQRQRGRSGLLQRRRQLARQEVEEPITPYPAADELKPEIPFDEAVPADEPSVAQEETVSIDEAAVAEPIPDEVYGPPEVAVLYNVPDEVYGPPEIEANSLPSDGTLALQRQKQARLVQARRQAAYRKTRLAKLRASKPKRSA